MRYAAGSGYSAHTHNGGEEILVLEGIFSDEYGDYPAGTYLRNPPGTSHQPFSKEGCTLLVKLWQFAEDDSTQLRLNTRQGDWQAGLVDGLSVLPLHEHNGVNTALVRWSAHTQSNDIHIPAAKKSWCLKVYFVMSSVNILLAARLEIQGYSSHAPFTLEQGALIYVKVGHIGAGLMGDAFVDRYPEKEQTL